MKDEIRSKLYQILRNHRGSDNPISARLIARLIGVEDTEGRPVTRAMIKEFIEKEGWPVAANRDGYYWIETVEELTTYSKNLAGRAREIENRRQRVVTNYYQARKFNGEGVAVSGY